jgi:hypothetical protein
MVPPEPPEALRVVLEPQIVPPPETETEEGTEFTETEILAHPADHFPHE